MASSEIRNSPIVISEKSWRYASQWLEGHDDGKIYGIVLVRAVTPLIFECERVPLLLRLVRERGDFI